MIYTLWLFVFVWGPTLILWTLNYRYLKHFPRTIGFCVVGSLVFSVPWDILAVKTDIWHFFEGNVVGLWPFGIPIEEYIFIVSVAVYMSTITLLLRKWMFKKEASSD